MEGVACAAVALAAAGQPEGVRVALLSPEEAPTSDAWQCSAHQVFRWAATCLPSYLQRTMVGWSEAIGGLCRQTGVARLRQ